jgi:hypothetical protein
VCGKKSLQKPSLPYHVTACAKFDAAYIRLVGMFAKMQKEAFVQETVNAHIAAAGVLFCCCVSYMIANVLIIAISCAGKGFEKATLTELTAQSLNTSTPQAPSSAHGMPLPSPLHPSPPPPAPTTAEASSGPSSSHSGLDDTQGAASNGFVGFVSSLIESIKARLITVKASHVAQFSSAPVDQRAETLPAALHAFAANASSKVNNIKCRLCGECPAGAILGFEKHVARKHTQEYVERCVDIAVTAFATAHSNDSLAEMTNKFHSTCECITAEWLTMVKRMQSDHKFYIRLQPSNGRIALYERARALGVADDLKCFFDLFHAALENYIKTKSSDTGKFGQRYNSGVKAVFLVTLNRGGASLFHFWENILYGPTVRTMQMLVSKECADIGFSDAMAADAFTLFYGYDPRTLPTHIAFDAVKVQGKWAMLGNDWIMGGDYLGNRWKVPFHSVHQVRELMRTEPTAQICICVFDLCVIPLCPNRVQSSWCAAIHSEIQSR